MPQGPRGLEKSFKLRTWKVLLSEKTGCNNFTGIKRRNMLKKYGESTKVSESNYAE